MQLKKIISLFNLWEKEGLVESSQKEPIVVFMKERRRKQYLRLVKWLFVLGAFWLFFGLMATLNLITPEFLKTIAEMFRNIFVPIYEFFVNVFEKIFGPNYGYAMSSFGCLGLWALFFYLGKRVADRENITEMKLDYFQETHLRGATSLYVLSYIAAGLAFSFLNRLLLDGHYSYYASEVKVIPYFTILGAVFFFYIAYRLKDHIAQLFGTYFVALSIGCFSAYGCACYWLSVSRPVLQLFVSIILVLVGFIHTLQSKEEDYLEHFGRNFQWTGMLLGFFALWIMSIWGFDFNRENYFNPSATEIWVGNILFISAALGGMFYGAKAEDKLFFNYGLTFLIIESYTVFFSHMWKGLGPALGALFLGVLLIGTGYLLRDLWLKKRSAAS